MPDAPYGSVTLSLTVKRAADALAFYAKAFDAKTIYRMDGPDGAVPHATFQVGDTQVYISDEDEAWHAYAMPEGTTASCLFTIEVADCDAAFRQAIDAGAAALSPPADQFWGARTAIIKDPFGYRWSFMQVVEELTVEEIDRRAKALEKGGAAGE